MTPDDSSPVAVSRSTRSYGRHHRWWWLVGMVTFAVASVVGLYVLMWFTPPIIGGPPG